MTSEMGWGAAAMSCTQVVILKQGFECYAIVIHGNAKRADRLLQPAKGGTNDRAFASNAFRRENFSATISIGFQTTNTTRE
jgi:hypothetical protein